MAQQIGNFLERTAAFNETARHCMAQGMGADIGQTYTKARAFDDFLYGPRCNGHSLAGNPPNEDGRVANYGSFVLEIISKGLAGFFWKRNHILPK